MSKITQREKELDTALADKRIRRSRLIRSLVSASTLGYGLLSLSCSLKQVKWEYLKLWIQTIRSLMLGWLASVAIQNVCPGEESKAGMLLKVTIKVFFPLSTSPWCPFSVVPQDGWLERGRKQASWCAFFLVCSLSWVHLFTSELGLHSWWPIFFSRMGIWQGEGLYSQFAFLITLTVDWLIDRWRKRACHLHTDKDVQSTHLYCR